MMLLKVTPERNVLINKRCFKSENMELFFSKLLNEGTKVDIYDIEDRKYKLVDPCEINARKHRMIINNKRFYICSMKAYEEQLVPLNRVFI